MSAAGSSSTSVDVVRPTLGVLMTASLICNFDNASISKYRLTLSGSSDSQLDPAYNRHVEMHDVSVEGRSSTTKPDVLGYLMEDNRPVPYMLHVRLFVDMEEAVTHLILLTDLAHGWVPMRVLLDTLTSKTSHAVPLLNVCGQPIASVVLTPHLVTHTHVSAESACVRMKALLPPASKERESVRNYNPAGIREAVIKPVSTFYRQLESDKGYKFPDNHPNILELLSVYSGYYGQIPVSLFPTFASRVVGGGPSQEAWLLHIMRIGAANMGVRDADDFDTLDVETQGNLLSDMLTLSFRGMVYAHDVTIQKRSIDRTTGCDDWVALNGCPDTGHNSYDCEDGAELVLEVMYALRYSVFRSKALTKLQAFIEPYTACFTMASIYNKKESFVPHAMVLLLDKNFVMGVKTGAVFVRPIIVESTTPVFGYCAAHHIQPPWTDGKFTDAQTKALLDFSSKHAFSEVLQREGHTGPLYRRTCRIKMDVSFAMGRSLYGVVWSIMPADLSDGSIRHIVFNDDEMRKIGVPMHRLLSYDINEGEMHTLVNIPLDSKERQSIDLLMAEWPRTQLPCRNESVLDYADLTKKKDSKTRRYLVYGPQFDDKTYQQRLLAALATPVQKEEEEEDDKKQKQKTTTAVVYPVTVRKFFITKQSYAYAVDVSVV